MQLTSRLVLFQKLRHGHVLYAKTARIGKASDVCRDHFLVFAIVSPVSDLDGYWNNSMLEKTTADFDQHKVGILRKRF